MLYKFLGCLNWIFTNFLHIWYNLLKICILARDSLQIVIKLIFYSHISLNTLIILFEVFCDGIISQMTISILWGSFFIILGCKPDIRFLIKPDCKGIPISNKHSLPNIKFSLRNDQRVLNILHHHPRCILILEEIQHFCQIFVYLYPPTSWFTTWFHYPHVLSSV